MTIVFDGLEPTTDLVLPIKVWRCGGDSVAILSVDDACQDRPGLKVRRLRHSN